MSLREVIKGRLVFSKSQKRLANSGFWLWSFNFLRFENSIKKLEQNCVSILKISLLKEQKRFWKRENKHLK